MMQIKGLVKRYLGRGTKLGFPTANLDVEVTKEEGVYLGKMTIDQDTKNALVFIGAPRTFGDEKRRVEVYILDFDQDIYGQEIAIELLKKIRENLIFDSPEKLVEQMKEDERQARAYFAREED